MATKLQQLERELQRERQEREQHENDMRLQIQKLTNTATKPVHIGKEYIKTSTICRGPIEILLALPEGFDDDKFLKREWLAADA